MIILYHSFVKYYNYLLVAFRFLYIKNRQKKVGERYSLPFGCGKIDIISPIAINTSNIIVILNIIDEFIA